MENLEDKIQAGVMRVDMLIGIIRLGIIARSNLTYREHMKIGVVWI